MISTLSARQRILATCGSLVALVSVLACSGDPVANAQRFVASGDRYASEGQLKEAVIKYGRAVQARPDWGLAHYNQAQTYLRLADPTKAFAGFTRAASLDPTNVDAHIQAGTLLLSAGQFDEVYAGLSFLLALSLLLFLLQLIRQGAAPTAPGRDRPRCPTAN